MLQFRARSLDKIKDPNCKVDCWIIPRQNNGTTLRYALYRFLVQGFRRCQSYWPVPLPASGVGGLFPEHKCEFFSGRPAWNVNGTLYGEHPGGFYRDIDVESGAFYWTHDNGPPPGGRVWDTEAFWQLQSNQGMNESIKEGEEGYIDGDIMEDEDIYNA